MSEPADNTMLGLPGRVISSTAGYVRRRRLEIAILVCMTAIYFFSFFQRIAVPGTIFDELQRAFGATAGQIAWLGALYLYIYGAMQLVAGLLSDRFGAVRVLLTGGCLLSLGSILFPLAPSLSFLYAARALVGLGASLIYISIVKAIDGLFSGEEFPIFLGVVIFLGYSGGLVGTLPFERFVSVAGWKTALLTAGVLCTLAFLTAAVLFRKINPLRQRKIPISSAGIAAILRNPLSIPLLVAGPLNFGVYFMVQATIGKKFLTDYCGLSSPVAAVFTFVMMLVTMTFSLAGGFVSRALGDRRKPIVVTAMLFTFVAACLLEVFLRLGLGAGWFLPCYILLAMSCLGSTVSSALMKESNPPEAVGTSIGIMNGAYYVAVAVATNLVGFIMDRYQSEAVITAKAVVYPPAAYEAIFLCCIGLSVIAVTAACCLRESRGTSIYPGQGATP